MCQVALLNANEETAKFKEEFKQVCLTNVVNPQDKGHAFVKRENQRSTKRDASIIPNRDSVAAHRLFLLHFPLRKTAFILPVGENGFSQLAASADG
jgi:hypothetical protein